MLSPKQQQIVGFANREGTFCLAGGTIRSGKTFSSVVAFILYTQQLSQPYKHLLAGRKLRVIEQELLPTIRDLASGLGIPYDYRRFDQILVVGEQEYIVLAGNDEKSQDRVLGFTLHSALIDEVTLVPESFFEACVSRLTFEDGKMWLCCNPSYPRHWLKKDWIDTGNIDEALEFVFEDNPTLSQKVIERNKKVFSGVFAKRMIEGQWCASEGLIFPDKKVERLDWTKMRRTRTVFPVDYGVATTTVLLVMMKLWRTSKQHPRGECVLYVADELYIDGGSDMENKTDAELLECFKFAYGEYPCDAFVVPPDAASLRAALVKARWRAAAVRQANTDVLAGIRTTGSMLKTGEIIIAPRCTRLLEEMDGYIWDPDKDDTPKKENDHGCDALRYGVMDLGRQMAHFDSILKPEGM